MDGVLGPQTIKCLQIFLQKKRGTYDKALDGQWGWWTVLGIQRWLRQVGLYEGYLLDGEGGYYTWYYTGMRVDQVAGNGHVGGGSGDKPNANLTLEIQRFLNVPYIRYK